jgi:hypothetical protein
MNTILPTFGNPKRTFLPVFISLVIIARVAAQPSGGPYGPVPQTYDLPQVTGKIYFVAPDGNESTPGEKPEQPTTIGSAIEKVVTGDAIVMRGGTYRTGGLLLNQGITIQPYLDEIPVMKGTLVAAEWRDLHNGLWVTTWEHLFPKMPDGWWRHEFEGRFTPLHRFNNDMVFIDGAFLQSAGWPGEVDESSYYIDYRRKEVYIGTDPADRLVEITAFDAALVRTTKECHGKVSDRIGPVIRGITFTQYAYRALEVEGSFPEGIAEESQYGKDVTGTLIEHCTLSFCSRVAAYLRGDRTVMRHCRVSDTSTEGVYVMSSNDVLLEKNIFARNNIERITGYYPAAVKIFNQCRRLTCQDNLVIDHPHSNGIWYDVGNVDGRFLNNWLQDIGSTEGEVTYQSIWPGQNAFFFEISKGAICSGNLFVNCDHGILVLNSSNVEISHNTLVNSMLCIARDSRSAQGDHFGWHPSTGPDVEERTGHLLLNNLMVAGKDFKRPLLLVWQPGFMCERLQDSQLSQVDHNVYVRESPAKGIPLILWSPWKNEACQEQLAHPEALHALYPAFSGHCAFYSEKGGTVFKSRELGRYELLKGSPAEAVIPYAGAYPPARD